MSTFLVILHVLVCLALILVVLLQSGKGAEIGASFGGSSNTLFGSRGSGNFLTKVTAVAGTIFMLTSLALSMMSSNILGGSVVEETPVKKEMPAKPATAGGLPTVPGAPAEGAANFNPAPPAQPSHANEPGGLGKIPGTPSKPVGGK